MLSPQKQTELEPITVKDWPVWDAACHVEGPTHLCCPIGPHAGLWVHRVSGRLTDSPDAALSPSATTEQEGRAEFSSVFPPTM